MKDNHSVVMTFPSSKFDVYGYCMTSFDKNWPENIKGTAICEEPENLPYTPSPRLRVLDFDETVGTVVSDFENRNKDKPIFDLGTTGNIALQAAKFARKVFAQLHVLRNPPSRFVWYTDADLETHQPISEDLLDGLTDGGHYMSFTPRWWKKNMSLEDALATKQLGKGYTETGLICWDTEHPAHQEWCDLYESCYTQDKIFEFDAWHDCVAFDYATITLILEKKIRILDLADGVRSSHPLVSGPLGKYFDHLKGQRKFVGESKERVRVHGKSPK